METIARYQVMHRLAIGGMAEVFLARTVGEGGFEKLVAIKRVLPHLALRESFTQMFIDEARISATLTHSNICQIFEFGRVGESYFIAMEYISGLSVRGILRHFKKLGHPPPCPLAAAVMSGVCAGLEYAHTKRDSHGRPLKIIHRDISPSNVLVSFDGEVKLIDFGVAKAARRMQETTGGDLKGKYAYMSPEQASGLAIDHRSDIFGAGIVLFELLTGSNPFRADTDLGTLSRIQRAQIPLPALTLQGDAIQLHEIATRALARRPEERFESAGEMQEALEQYSQRNVFGTRQLARFMRETFPVEEHRQQELVRKATERLEHEPDESTVEMPTTELEDKAPQEPIPLTRPRRPTGQVQVAALLAAEDGAPSRSATPTPLTPSSSSNVGKVAIPAEPPSSTSLRRPARSSPWIHVVLFMLFATAVAGTVYLLLTRMPDRERGAAPVGSLRINARPALPAQVFVDGELHGAMTPGEAYVVKRLLAGKHRIMLRGSQFHELETVVEVVRGETTPLAIILEKK